MCKCRANSQDNSKVISGVRQKDNSILVTLMSKPEYTWEEVIEVKDYINSKNKTEEGRLKLVRFNEKYFGEVIPGYCDQACIERTRRRLDRATELLTEWEQNNNTI